MCEVVNMMCPNNTVDSEIWISCHFHVSQNIILLIYPTNIGFCFTLCAHLVSKQEYVLFSWLETGEWTTESAPQGRIASCPIQKDVCTGAGDIWFTGTWISWRVGTKNIFFLWNSICWKCLIFWTDQLSFYPSNMHRKSPTHYLANKHYTHVKLTAWWSPTSCGIGVPLKFFPAIKYCPTHLGYILKMSSLWSCSFKLYTNCSFSKTNIP